MDVVILAGGLGTRLRDTLAELPKVLAPIRDRPFLDYLLQRLALLGAGRAILSLGFLADKVQNYLVKCGPPLPVQTIIESQPLGTGGALKLAADQTKSDPVLVMNGDTWCEADYGAFLESHTQSGLPCSLLCVPVGDTSRYGKVELAANGRISRFSEKSAAVAPGIISAGIYLFSQSALRSLADTQGPSLEFDFLQKDTTLKAGLHGFIANGASFIDIGTPESLREAQHILEKTQRS